MFFFLTTDGNVVENLILKDIILLFIIYFVIPMMLWVDLLLRSYVVIEPHLLLGKAFSFTPDEASVEDLVKASVLTNNLLC